VLFGAGRFVALSKTNFLNLGSFVTLITRSAFSWSAPAPPLPSREPREGGLPARKTAPVTVIIPAYNEESTLGATIRSLLQQTVRPDLIVVVDDCSTDATAKVARSLGVTVIRPPRNTGSKAGAQTFALASVTTPLVMALDADTELAPDALERLLPALDDPRVAAVCGFVLPRQVGTLWERGRYIEYLFAFSFYKQVQEQYERPLISSGCCSLYRTSLLRQMGGWSRRTMAEDMDLTWSFYEAGLAVRFVPEAVCYPVEPHSFGFLAKQLKRWSHGFVQNVRLHWRGLLGVRYLRWAVAVAFWDATIASLLYLMVLPLLALLLRSPWLLLGYVIDVPAVLVPVLAGAIARREVGRALASLPAFFVLRTVNGFFFLRAAWDELIRGRSLSVYEKGH